MKSPTSEQSLSGEVTIEATSHLHFRLVLLPSPSFLKHYSQSTPITLLQVRISLTANIPGDQDDAQMQPSFQVSQNPAVLPTPRLWMESALNSDHIIDSPQCWVSLQSLEYRTPLSMSLNKWGGTRRKGLKKHQQGADSYWDERQE